MSTTISDSLAQTAIADGAARQPAGGGALVGQVLHGRYEIVDFLGAGGMGEVYRARDRELDDIVAVKVLRSELATRNDLVDRFRNEVRLARRVTHRAVARTFEFGEASGLRYLTMEFVDGESVARLLARAGRIGLDQCLSLSAEVCDALDAAHAAGIVHGDIKPDNVLMTRTGRAVVTDFGVARLTSDQAGDLAGTPSYMAPEQVRGEPATPRSDLYALGVTMFELATGRLPFVAERSIAMMIARLDTPPPDPRELQPDLPADFAQAVLRAMARDPGERFADALELRSALQAVATRRSLPPSAITVEPKRLRARPWTTVEVRSLERTPKELLYLTCALHAEITLGLGRVPLVRVITRSSEPSDACVVVSGAVIDGGERIVMSATTTGSGEPLWSARMPLSSHRLEEVADAVQSAISLALDAPRSALPPAESAPPEVLDLCLRARFHYHRPISSEIAHAHALYTEAMRLAPRNSRVLAGFAMIATRHGFFAGLHGTLDDAAMASESALAIAPHRPEPHLAAGSVALHTGDPVKAAHHFRSALALAPAWPEAHEWLGRMLVEAGSVNDGIQRLEQAVRLDTNLSAVRYEIGRALALDGNWADYDRLIAELAGDGGRGRWLAQLRVAGWRRDPGAVKAVVAALERAPAGDVFDPPFLQAMLAVLLDGAWSEHRELLIGRVHPPYASERRMLFYCQVAIELAGIVGDAAVVLDLLEHATGRGLFDLHWLERCPSLECVRDTARYAAVHRGVTELALRVSDALYDS